MTSYRLSTSAIIPVAFFSSALFAGVAPVAAKAGAFSSRIVNGTPSAEYPSAGALVVLSPADHTVAALCSGTMIGCQTFLTAAHCVCPEGAANAAMCVQAGVTNPALLRVFLQHAGLFQAASVAVNPAYDIERGGDAAIIHLVEPVSGVAGTPIGRDAPVPPNTLGTIVGFGRTGGNPDFNLDAGVKRWGRVLTAECSNVPSDAYVCWTFSGEGSNTCQGDSGGPLLVDLAAGSLVAGIHSGGASQTCLAPDMGYDTSVFANRDWIEGQTGSDPTATSCGGLPAAGAPGTDISTAGGELSSVQPQGFATFTVAPGRAQLRLALNGQIFSLDGRTEVRNDFDLYVAKDRTPTLVDHDCRDVRPGPFGYCEIDMPAAGTWFALASRVNGSGAYQLTATTLSVDTCRGDCTDDGLVSIDDLLTAVNIALAAAPLTDCPAFAAPGSETVTIDNIILAVSNAADGCSPAAITRP